MIWISALLLIGALLGFVVLLKAALTRAGKLVGRVTYERHTAAEGILSTGRVPEAWRTAAGGGDGVTPAESRAYLGRLDELIKYFENAPVFDEEPTRRVLLEELRAVRSRWERGLWEAPVDEPLDPISPSPPRA